MSEHMLWETIDEQKRKIADLEQDLEHKKIAIRSRNARIKELEAQVEKMKMCCNCRKWRECGEQLDYVSYPCHQHNCDDVCPIWELWERR